MTPSPPAVRRRPAWASVAEAAFSVIGWIGIAWITVFFTLLIFCLYLVHRWFDPRRRLAHRVACLWGRWLISTAPLSHLTILGKENLKQLDKPVIFLANHQSYADVPALCCLALPFKWVADYTLFRIPIFGWAMRMAGYIPIKRGDPHWGFRSLEEARRWLKEGMSIFLFPEGTRSSTGVLGRFQTGGFRLAVSTGTPIVPVVLVGTRYLLPRGSWIFRWGVRVTIHLLDPITIASSDLRQVHPLVRQVRRQMLSVYRQHLRELILARRERAAS